MSFGQWPSDYLGVPLEERFNFNPLTYFLYSGIDGAWFDPSDMSTMFQDAAGTTPVTALEQPVGLWLDKSGNGNHATQSITASRPTLSARYNWLLNSATLSTQSVTTSAAQYTLSFTGTGSVTLSGSATGTLVGTGVSNRVSLQFTSTSGTLALTVTGSVTLAMLAFGTLTEYQEITTATSYDSVGWPRYVRFDGIDDYLLLPHLGLYAGGKCSVVSATNVASQAIDSYLIAERNTVDSDSLYSPARRKAGFGLHSVITNDAGTTVLDSADNYLGERLYQIRTVTDTGSTITTYKDGKTAASVAYTRSGQLTLNTTAIGASVGPTVTGYLAMNLYGLIVTKDVLNNTQRRYCERWLSRKVNQPIYDDIFSYNSIGEMGGVGAGVGICPILPTGYTKLEGTETVGHDNWGNYQYKDGSIQAWVPAFYYRIGHVDNTTYPEYGVNSVDIRSYTAFESEAVARDAGWVIHRAFIDGGQVKPGFMFDKYICSNNGGIASSIKNGNPLSSAAEHNPFSGLTGAPSNTYGGAWAASKTRGKNFFVAPRFMYAALALLSLAHGQAAKSTTNCAWFDAYKVSNFPKGCNNNALRDVNDTSVLYTSEGYSQCGKTGSGVPFAKTTHNGQSCGIADLNGLMWEVSQGVTCIATSKTITAATKTNPVALTITAHGMTTGAQVQVTGIVGMTQLNDKIYIATVVDANTITLNGVDGTAFTTYTSGGTATYGTFYVAKESAVMANFTGGNSLSTDHFGSVGVAANMDAFTPAFATTYPNNSFIQKPGNSANQVLSPDLTGNNAVLRSLGIPIAAGMSTSGSNLFGQDFFYQYIRNELCLHSGANWFSGSDAGVWAAHWHYARTYSSSSVGLRSASFPVGPYGSDDA